MRACPIAWSRSLRSLVRHRATSFLARGGTAVTWDRCGHNLHGVGARAVGRGCAQEPPFAAMVTLGERLVGGTARPPLTGSSGLAGEAVQGGAAVTLCDAPAS